MILEDEAHDW
jgi:GMP synthase-like glutamine amidotransferase